MIKRNGEGGSTMGQAIERVRMKILKFYCSFLNSIMGDIKTLFHIIIVLESKNKGNFAWKFFATELMWSFHSRHPTLIFSR